MTKFCLMGYEQNWFLPIMGGVQKVIIPYPFSLPAGWKMLRTETAALDTKMEAAVWRWKNPPYSFEFMDYNVTEKWTPISFKPLFI